MTIVRLKPARNATGKQLKHIPELPGHTRSLSSVLLSNSLLFGMGEMDMGCSGTSGQPFKFGGKELVTANSLNVF